jgi:hypothetical protein
MSLLFTNDLKKSISVPLAFQIEREIFLSCICSSVDWGFIDPDLFIQVLQSLPVIYTVFYLSYSSAQILGALPER